MSSQAAAAAVPRRRNTAALVWHQVRYEQLSFWRNPQSAFFLFATGPPSSSRWSSARPRSALGVAVASLISNAEAAPAVVQFVFFPLVFISGTYFQITSRFLNDLAGVFPVRPFNQALLNPFALDRGFAGRQLLVLAIWGIAGGFVAIRRFRWDPRPERYQAAVRLTLMNPGRQLDRTAQAATRRQAHGHASSPGPQPPLASFPGYARLSASTGPAGS